MQDNPPLSVEVNVLGMLIAVVLGTTEARANFFWHDQYEPPSPHFGTLYYGVGAFAGGYGTPTLDVEPRGGPAWNAIGGLSVMVLPATKVGLRAGFGTYGAKTSDGPNTPFVGFRQQAAWTDAIASITLPYLELYGGPSLLALSRVKAPLWATDAPGFELMPFRPRNKSGAVAASYRHVAAGATVRYLPSARQSGGETVTGVGLTLEVRRTFMETRDLVAFAPSEAAGWMVLGTIAIEARQNASRTERKEAR